MHVRPRSTLVLVVAFVAAGVSVPRAGQQAPKPDSALVEPLAATPHPPLPRDPLRLWLAPLDSTRRAPAAVTSFSSGARLYADARYAEALPLLSVRLAGTPLDSYASYYRGLTELRLSRLDAAERTFKAMLDGPLTGYLSEAVRLRAAEVAEAQQKPAAAAALYAEVAAGKPVAPEDVLLRLARALQASGDPLGAAKAWARIYYEYPFSDQAALAQAALDQAGAWQPLEAGSSRFQLELGRAERLFASRRYAQARSAFEALQPVATGDAEEVVALRLAECDHYLRRFRAARDALEPWLQKAARRAEAQFFYLTATRELGGGDEYVRLARALVAAFPNESWAEETLNNLATHYILADDDDAADRVFREILERYPQSGHAPRAAWKVGWSAYRKGDYAEAVRWFEMAAARFPRSDYRPSWLYWAARAHEQLGERDLAAARYELVVSDYRNSYYGRMADHVLTERGVAPVVRTAAPAVAADADAGALPPTQDVIRALIAQSLYDDAMNELQYAQRTWGDTPAIEATIGLVYSRTGELRRGINAMKRAYPQYLAAGGEQMPVEMLKVLFPLAYWDLIRKYSTAHGLDPYLMAALMAQESTFDPAIKSHANAVGLMQVLPSTGRHYARRVGLKRFRPSMLTNPDVNIRLGTAVFAELVDRFGSAHLALASYNAGESAVARWVAERPGIGREEFIDDIPYPETQNYVRKIVGTADDYRRLYGTLNAQPGRPAVSHPDVVPASNTTVSSPSHKKKASRHAPAHKKSHSKKKHPQ